MAQGDSSPASSGEAITTPPPPPRWSLPSWLDHFNIHDLKLVFRCWVATWAATVLIFIHPVLQTIGVSTFFGSLLLYIVPPATIVFVYILAQFSLLFGMCLAWAWGLATMRAAQAVRDPAEYAMKLGALNNMTAQIAQSPGNTKARADIVRELVYNGFVLDARVTAVYYVMGCAFIYAVARMRMGNAKLILFQLFGTIVTDIFILIGPLLTQWTPEVAAVLVKPGAIGVGIGLVCCLLLFPQSTSHAVLDGIEKLVRLTGASTESTRRRLADQAVHIEELQANKGKVIGVYKATEPALGFLPIDLSRGRWNADDVQGLFGQVRAAMSASLSLFDFHIAWITAIKRSESYHHHRDESLEKGDGRAKTPVNAGDRQLDDYADLVAALRTPESSEKFEQTREALLGTTSELLDLCAQATQLSADCIHTANSNRWIRTPSQATFDSLHQRLQETIANLKTTKESCVKNTNDAVLAKHANLFDEAGNLKVADDVYPPSLQGIILSMVIEERILAVANAMEGMMEYLVKLLEARKSHRIWFPTRMQYAAAWLLNSKTVVPVSANSAEPGSGDPETLDPAGPSEQAKEAYSRLRASQGIRGAAVRRSFLTRAIMGTYDWLTNPAGMYALRMVIVTVATSIPAALPHTAGFFYREKGIWGVITAQTCVLVYMSDFTFSLISRGLGTVLGGVMGVVAWYIGSGTGEGNPYGLGAITAVATLILVWWRLFLPAAYLQAVVMTTSTFALVIGFSYDHRHLLGQYGLPGSGYTAFWKRLVTVLLGFVAATVVQIFPKPPSATKHISKTLANTIRALSDHYALLLSHWARSSPADSPLGAVTEELSLGVADTLMSLNESLALLHIEASSSPFTQTSLNEVQSHCQLMNQSLSKMLDISTTLPQDLQQRLGTAVGMTDDRVIGQIMAVLGIVEESLRTGSPLPERLPTPLVRTIYDTWTAQHRNAILSTTLVRDENYRRFCVAMSSYLQFLSTVDDLVLTLKKTLGECYVVHTWEV